MAIFTRRHFLHALLLTPGFALTADDAFIRERRARTLRYVESMRFKDGAFGRYRYSAGMPEPTLYSSTYAAMTRSLYRDLDSLTKTQREEWIDPLARLLKTSPQNTVEIEKALARAENHMRAQQNDDGGLTWIRGEKFQYGHPLLAAPVDGSGMFPTWFRTLALAYLGKALPASRTGAFDWHFAQCPGIQFFHP